MNELRLRGSVCMERQWVGKALQKADSGSNSIRRASVAVCCWTTRTTDYDSSAAVLAGWMVLDAAAVFLSPFSPIAESKRTGMEFKILKDIPSLWGKKASRAAKTSASTASASFLHMCLPLFRPQFCYLLLMAGIERKRREREREEEVRTYYLELTSITHFFYL